MKTEKWIPFKIHCMVCFCCKGSFNSCMPIWHRRSRQSGGWHKFWPKFFRGNYHPKLSNFGRSYLFTALLAKIDTHIRSYLNPSIMKVNWEKFGPCNFWMLSRPILQYTITKFAFCEKQHFDTYIGLISIWMLQCGFLCLYHLYKSVISNKLQVKYYFRLLVRLRTRRSVLIQPVDSI